MSFLKLVDLDALSRFKAKIMQLIPSAWAGSTSAGGPATIANGLPSGKVDSTSTATAFTATISGITEYYDGLTIILKNGVVTSASGFTLNINGLGAKPSYSNMATGNDVTPTAPTRDTTIFNINYTMIFVYSVDVVEGGGWISYRGYDANINTIGYQIRTQAVSLPMDSVTYRYRLLFQSVDGKKFVPANNSNSTNATASRTVIQTPIDPFGLIVYYGTTASVAAGAKPSSSYLWQQFNGISLGYSFNRTGAALTMTTSLPIYLKCAPQSNGSAIIDSATPFVQALPSSADGKIYIFLGIAESATAMMLTLEHPVYEYKDGAVRQWTNAAKPTIPSPSSATPQALGTASAGVSDDYSRADHVHAMPTASNIGAIPAPSSPSTGQVLMYSNKWEAMWPEKSLQLPWQVIPISYNGTTFSTTISPADIDGGYIVEKDEYPPYNRSSFTKADISGTSISLVPIYGNADGIVFQSATFALDDIGYTDEIGLLRIEPSVGYKEPYAVILIKWPAENPSPADIGAIPAPLSPSSGQILSYNNGGWIANDLYQLLNDENALTIVISYSNDIFHIAMDFADVASAFSSCRKVLFFTEDELVFNPIGFDLNTGTLELACIGGVYNYQRLTFHPNLTDGGMDGTLELIPTGADKITNPGSASSGDILGYNGSSWVAVTPPAGLPSVTSSDNGKVLRVVNGAWAAANLPSANGVSF